MKFAFQYPIRIPGYQTMLFRNFIALMGIVSINLLTINETLLSFSTRSQIVTVGMFNGLNLTKSFLQSISAKEF